MSLIEYWSSLQRNRDYKVALQWARRGGQSSGRMMEIFVPTLLRSEKEREAAALWCGTISLFLH